VNAKRKYFPTEDVVTYTELDLDRGVGMVFHPLTGTPLNRLRYDAARRQFCSSFPCGGWSFDSETIYYETISAGDNWTVGQPFPVHWRFHPLTGQALPSIEKEKKS